MDMFAERGRVAERAGCRSCSVCFPEHVQFVMDMPHCGVLAYVTGKCPVRIGHADK